jgi:hypothetical protein
MKISCQLHSKPRAPVQVLRRMRGKYLSCKARDALMKAARLAAVARPKLTKQFQQI